jgi:plastocyanin
MEGLTNMETPIEADMKPHRNRFYTLALVAVIVVAVIGIGISSSVLFSMNMIELPASEATSSIILTDEGVTPAVVTVKKGNAVTWTNRSHIQHQLEITSPNQPQALEGFEASEPLAEGDSYSFIFETAGTYTYDDSSEPLTAQGTIIVEEK